jgi:rhodanese-related sulfurtransferase
MFRANSRGRIIVPRPLLSSLVLACLAWFPLAAGAAGPPKIHIVDYAALTALLDAPDEKLLIDTRAEESYARGHLPGAVNLPGPLFDKDQIPGLPENRSLMLIPYCSGGHCGIAEYVGERLLDLGYQNVYVYDEGAQGWLERGQNLVTKKQEDSPALAMADFGALLATGAALQLVDARSAVDFAKQTSPGGRNLPPDQCRPGAKNLPAAQDQPVVVFGQSHWDARPYAVADCLRSLGYRNVRIYALGLNRWPHAGQAPPPVPPAGKAAP